MDQIGSSLESNIKQEPYFQERYKSDPQFQNQMDSDPAEVRVYALIYYAKETGKDFLKAGAIFIGSSCLGSTVDAVLKSIPADLVSSLTTPNTFYDIGSDLSNLITPLVEGGSQWFAAHKVFGEKEGKSKKVFEFLLKWNAISCGIEAVKSVGENIHYYGTEIADYSFQKAAQVPSLITSSLNGVNTVFSTVHDVFPSMIVAGLSTAKVSVLDLYNKARAKLKTVPGRELLLDTAKVSAVLVGTYFAYDLSDPLMDSVVDKIPLIGDYLNGLGGPAIGSLVGLVASNKLFSNKQGNDKVACEFLTKWYAIHVGVGAFTPIGANADKAVNDSLDFLVGSNGPDFLTSLSTEISNLSSTITGYISQLNHHYTSAALALAHTAGKRFPEEWNKIKTYAKKGYNFVKEPAKPVIGGVLGYIISSYIAAQSGADAATAQKIGEFTSIPSAYFTSNLIGSRAWRLAAKTSALLYGGQIIGNTDAIMDNVIDPVDNFFGNKGIADAALRYGSQIGVLAGIKSAYNRTIGKAFRKTPQPTPS